MANSSWTCSIYGTSTFKKAGGFPFAILTIFCSCSSDTPPESCGMMGIVRYKMLWKQTVRSTPVTVLDQYRLGNLNPRPGLMQFIRRGWTADFAGVQIHAPGLSHLPMEKHLPGRVPPRPGWL